MSRTGDDGRRYIDQFMWAFQEHFRLMLEIRAKSSFKLLGLAVDPRAMLVGFDESGERGHSICVEPEDGPYLQTDFEAVMARGDVLYSEDDDRQMLVTGEGQQEQFEAGSLDRVRGLALQEALQASGREPGRQYFVGYSSVVADYRVFPVLTVLGARWEAVPTLPDYDAGRMRISNSLPEELIYRLLQLATLSLGVGNGPSDLVSIGRDTAEDLVRVSASVFMDGIPARLDGLPSELMESLDALAVTPYEGRAASGRITFIRPGPEKPLTLELKAPVSLRETRRARKVLEMTSAERHLASDGKSALGLVAKAGVGNTTFSVEFTGRGMWSLSYGGTDYMHVVQGRASLPASPLDFGLFEDNFRRLFDDFPNANPSVVWDLVQEASVQVHGTMLVIHRDAAGEAERLGSQAFPVEPVPMGKESIAAASSIDGAVLIAPDGQCHAIGVILDGIAGNSGDPARGARFNSATRYVDEHRSDCLILVVSEDGSVEIVPTPRRRVKSSFIEALVGDVVSASSGAVDFRQFNRLVDRASAHKFYLSQEQCDRISAAREKVDGSRKGSAIRIIDSPWTADSTMNDSYFLLD